MEPITLTIDLSSEHHMGNGIPQKRDLDKFQSFAFASQFPKRPSPVDFGFQLIVLLRETISFRTSVTLMNQESRG